MSYQNPVPHLGGKKFNVNITFDFPEWVEMKILKNILNEMESLKAVFVM